MIAVFFFIYHIEKGREKSPGLGMSPCPEYDLALALEEGPVSMHVISPPLRLAQAFRALEDIKGRAPGDLRGSFNSISRSVSVYGAGARMPSGLVRVDPAAASLKEEAERAAVLLEPRIRGRILRYEEARSSMEPCGPSMVAMAAQRLVLRSDVADAGIAYRELRRTRVLRCSATAGFVISDCLCCGSSGYLVCGECSSMGTVRNASLYMPFPRPRRRRNRARTRPDTQV